jgi:hypothetical protein
MPGCCDKQIAKFASPMLLLAVALSWIQAPSAVADQNPFCAKTTSEQVRAATTGPAVGGVSVALQRKRVAPGQVIRARLVNFGENRAIYGPQYRIERYVGGKWIVDPASPRGPWHKVFWLLTPDAAGRCFQFSIPVGQPPGTYRFVIPVKTDKGRSGRTAVFRVPQTLRPVAAISGT